MDQHKHMADFQHAGYTVLRGVLDRVSLAALSTYASLQQLSPDFYTTNKECHSLDRYADPMGEGYLLHCKPLIEAATGLQLLPTYSFLRLYQRGSLLEKHTDRPSCEISATLAVGYKGAEQWPIYLEQQGHEIAVCLDQSDMLLYRGMDLPHWRPEFTGRQWVQLFLHYVDAHGPFTEHVYDSRPGLGVPLRGKIMKER